MTSPSATLLFDACVVSDILKADAEVVSLIKRYVGPVYVPDMIVEELSRSFNLEDIDKLGLEILEISDETRLETQKVKDRDGLRKLSEQDASCLLTARQMHCVCVTNDRLLRRACVDFGVSILWELEVILKLYERDGFTYERATGYVESLRKGTTYITDEVFDLFNSELNRIREQKTSPN